MTTPRSVYMFIDSSGYGGTGKAVLTLIDGLDQSSWLPTLVYNDVADVTPLASNASRLGATLWAVPPMPEGLAGAARVPRFAAALRSRRPDVFHAHLNLPNACKFGLAAAVLARVPAVVATEHLFVDLPMSRSTYIQQRALGARVGRYIAVSQHVEQRLHETFQWPLSKLSVVPNGIDASRLRCEPNPELRAGLSRDGTRHVVLSTARLVPDKGLMFLLEAAAELPGIQVVIAGKGPQRDGLERRAQELGLSERVDFLGHRDDVPELLACSDVVVLPSLNEGLPLAALEAMAAEKPIVATSVGGTDETVIDGQSGLLVAPGDSRALATAIRRLLDDPSGAAALARAARSRVEQSFSCTTMVDRVTGIYGELLAGSLTSSGR